MRSVNCLLLVLTTTLPSAFGFYLPGIAPKYYKAGDTVPLQVNVVQSTKSLLPYEFYHPRFHFCRPDRVQNEGESLGSVLMGDRIFNSKFEILMYKNETCKALCTGTVPGEDAGFINDRIKEDYYLHWEIDGLPAASVKQEINLKTKEETTFYSVGFPLGDATTGSQQPEFNNHYRIEVQVHSKTPGEEDATYAVVGVVVYPYSRRECDGDDSPVYLLTSNENSVPFTYDVVFKDSDIEWRGRWDLYLHVFDARVHWFNLINSIVITFFLTGMVAMILLRALHKDIARYNNLEAQEDAQEEFGWKLVHGDVFRPPKRFMLLSVLLGNGAQIVIMAATTLLFAAFGFLSPSNRGALVTTILVVYVCVAFIAGFVSSRFYKMFGGESWKTNVLLTAFLVPGLVFLIFLTLNFFLIGAGSSAAVPFTTILALIFMFFLVSVPLCFVGAYLGFKKPRIEAPVRTNQIPRQIPEQPFYLRTWTAILMGGILPFGAIFIELYFIMNSIWGQQIYYVFGFLFFVGLILLITCAEVTILMCYFQLCAENYNWWWRAFFTSGASAFYMMIYAGFFYSSRFQSTNFASSVLYFGWSAVMSVMFFLWTGFVGFVACYLFVRKIYASIKID